MNSVKHCRSCLESGQRLKTKQIVQYLCGLCALLQIPMIIIRLHQGKYMFAAVDIALFLLFVLLSISYKRLTE